MKTRANTKGTPIEGNGNDAAATGVAEDGAETDATESLPAEGEEGSEDGDAPTVIEEPKAKGKKKASATTESVEALLRGSKWSTVKVHLQGQTPLLMASMPREQIMTALIRRERAPVQTDLPESVMAAKFLYLDPKDGKTVGIPGKCLYACIRDAGTLVKFDARRSISTAAGPTLLSLFLRIQEQFIPLEPRVEWKGEENEEPKGWAVDVERGQMDNGTTVGIIRPRFDEWSIRVTLKVNFSVVAEATVVKLLQTAGLVKGLCANRPGRGGQNGQFQIEPEKGWEKQS